MPFPRACRFGLMLLAALLVEGCGDPPRSDPAGGFQERAIRINTALVDRLEALGYFRQLPADQLGIHRQAILRQGWTALFSGPPHRLNPADAEDLAEGGLVEFFRTVRPFLVAEGVKLPEMRAESGATGHVLYVGDVAHVIYSREELQRDKDGEQPGLIRGLSMARTFALINRLLAAAGSPERVYAVGADNDLFAFFLTPELFELIVGHPDATPPEAPYVPNDTYPNFGHPEWTEGVVP
jgi:hypothetical protein